MFTLKQTLAVVVFILAPLLCFSEDSLEIAYKKKFQEAKNDTVGINLFLELADSYHANLKPIEKSLYYAEKALTESEKLNYINGIVKSSEKLAFYHRLSGNYKEGIRLINNALAKLNTHSRPELFDLLYIEKGFNFYTSGETDSMGIVSKKLVRTVSTTENLLKAHILLGSYYSHEHHFKEAVEEFLRVIQIAEETDHPKKKFIALTNIASIYSDLGNLEEALNYADELIKITEGNGFNDIYGFAHMTKAQCFIQVRDFEEAIECYKIAEHSFSEINDFYQKAMIAYLIGSSYHDLKNYK